MKAHKITVFAVFWVFFSAGVYLFFCARTYRIGFPLDDAWIHQTYARNFAAGYGWSFETGKVSAGATAPLWTVLLSLGYFFKIDVFLWAFVLGSVLLVGVGILAIKVFQGMDPSLSWLGLFFLMEWHFNWASLSGMETILATFVVMGVYYLLAKRRVGWEVSGFLAASIWIRPDLLTLMLPVSISALLTVIPRSPAKTKRLLPFSVMILSVFAYLVFNRSTSGAWLPTTFYAKQAEYAELRALPFGLRAWQQFSTPLIGGGSLLLFGFVARIRETIKNRDWPGMSWIGWYFVMVGLYAARLPVTYQHGRYMMPAMAVYFLLGLEGSLGFFHWLNEQRKLGWILIRTGTISWILVTISFWGLGARTYANDVQLIETQMVDVAKWVKKNLPPESRVAVHDIGAVGYFTQVDLVDLAGLINPEVIPFLRDEHKLAEYLDEKQVEYLICFPDWYPSLTQGLTVLYQADERAVRDFGRFPMSIYRWRLNNFIRFWKE